MKRFATLWTLGGDDFGDLYGEAIDEVFQTTAMTSCCDMRQSTQAGFVSIGSILIRPQNLQQVTLRLNGDVRTARAHAHATYRTSQY